MFSPQHLLLTAGSSIGQSRDYPHLLRLVQTSRDWVVTTLIVTVIKFHETVLRLTSRYSAYVSTTKSPSRCTWDLTKWACTCHQHSSAVCMFVCFWRDTPQWARASSFTRLLDHTQGRTKVGRTPLEEWSARRRDFYLTTNKHPCLCGIRIHNLSRRAAADLSLRTYDHCEPLCFCSGLPFTVRMCLNGTISPSIILPAATLYIPGSNVKLSGQENDFSRLARSNQDWNVPIKIL